MGVELDHAIAFGVGHMVGKHARAFATRHGAVEQLVEIVAVVDVVTQHQRRQVVADEALTDDERLGQAIRRWLYRVGDVDTPLVAIAQQLLEARRVQGGGDDQDIADTRQHQRGQRIVDHRFVVHRQQLLGNRQCRRVQAGARAPGQNDAFTLFECAHMSCFPERAL
ncbi:hypothetical protein D3C76_1254600 [compost metagenome]